MVLASIKAVTIKLRNCIADLSTHHPLTGCALLSLSIGLLIAFQFSVCSNSSIRVAAAGRQSAFSINSPQLLLDISNWWCIRQTTGVTTTETTAAATTTATNTNGRETMTIALTFRQSNERTQQQHVACLSKRASYWAAQARDGHMSCLIHVTLVCTILEARAFVHSYNIKIYRYSEDY